MSSSVKKWPNFTREFPPCPKCSDGELLCSVRYAGHAHDMSCWLRCNACGTAVGAEEAQALYIEAKQKERIGMSAFEETEAGSAERLKLIDEIDKYETVRKRDPEPDAALVERVFRAGPNAHLGVEFPGKISELILPEESFTARLKHALKEGVIFGAKWAGATALSLLMLFLAGHYIYGRFEAWRIEQATTAAQALNGQKAFQYLNANAKSFDALVTAETERQKAAEKK